MFLTQLSNYKKIHYIQGISETAYYASQARKNSTWRFSHKGFSMKNSSMSAHARKFPSGWEDGKLAAYK
jgi:hypothetical protein